MVFQGKLFARFLSHFAGFIGNVTRILFVSIQNMLVSGKVALQKLFRTGTPESNSEILGELKVIHGMVATLLERSNKMALDITALTEEVSRVQTVQASATALLVSLAEELERIAAEPKVDVEATKAAITDLVEKLKGSTDALSGAVADSAGVIPQADVVLHADDPETPTIEIVLPEVLPEVVEVSVEQVVDVVDPASEEPQFVIIIEEASPEVVAAVEATAGEVLANPDENFATENGEVASIVIETEEGTVDVVLVADAEVVAEYKEEHSIDILEEVKDAYEAADEVVAAPEAVEETE
jgi:hypothetical protein